MTTILPLLQQFIPHPNSSKVNIPMLCKTAPIDFDDPLLELLPEVYIDSKPYNVKAVHEAMDVLARELACGLIRLRKEYTVVGLNAKN